MGNRRRAFTLVELLVVIAIVAVLLGVLVPALAKARASARVVACQANQRQVGLAIQAYAAEYDGLMPLGPEVDGPVSIFDFYRITGMLTSLISTTDGEPVGLGLLLEEHLSEQPLALFCPGADQQVETSAELARVGQAQAQGSYWYRHASRISQFEPLDKRRVRLAVPFENRNGDPAQALAMDSNFVAHEQLALFGVVTRTHHQAARVNVLLRDGSSETRNNADGRYTADVGARPDKGPEMMLQAFETADRE